VSRYPVEILLIPPRDSGAKHSSFHPALTLWLKKWLSASMGSMWCTSWGALNQQRCEMQVNPGRSISGARG
jgi:hypothetical protein